MSRFRRTMTVGLLTGMLGLSLFPFAHRLEEHAGLDILFKFRGARKAPEKVVIVTLDRVSAKRLGLPPQPDEWPRAYHARLIDALAGRGVKVIAFDMLFEEPSSDPDDLQLSMAIKRAGNVVLCECLRGERVPVRDKRGRPAGSLRIERRIPPMEPLARAARATAPFPLPKVPVKLNQYWTFKESAGDVPTLPLVVFQVFALEDLGRFVRILERVNPALTLDLTREKQAAAPSKGIESSIHSFRMHFQRNARLARQVTRELRMARGKREPKGDQTLQSLMEMYRSPQSRYLNFYGPPGTVATIPYHRILEPGSPGASDPALEGKAIFVGLSGCLRPEQKDGFYTVFSQPDGRDISGVEVAATAFGNLLEDMPVEPLQPPVHAWLLLLWGLYAGVVCWLLAPVFAALFVIGSGTIYFGVAFFQFKEAALWFPLVVPLFIQAPFAFSFTVLWKFFHSSKERKNIRRAFGYYLPDPVVDRLVKDIGQLKTGSQIVYGTCLNTDAEKYTTLSEDMDPQALSRFMNAYYEVVFGPVRHHGGIVSDVIGDAMLAIWATTRPDTGIRRKACEAALDIVSAVKRFNRSSPSLPLPTRIGLHSGRMLLGNIGAVDHYEYRAVGDIVNTVSRIEGLNKRLGTRILASEELLTKLDDFLTRNLGLFVFAGKSRAIMVHEILCRRDDASEEQEALCDMFTEALKAYHAQSWEAAIRAFDDILKIRPDDGPSRFFRGQCENYRSHPPAGIWDGHVKMNMK